MKTTAPTPTFTPEELREVRSAALRLWNEIAYDAFEAGGRRRKSLKRAEVVELVCDAGRLEDQLRRMNRKELAEKIAHPDVDLEGIVSEAFPYASYCQ